MAKEQEFDFDEDGPAAHEEPELNDPADAMPEEEGDPTGNEGDSAEAETGGDDPAAEIDLAIMTAGNQADAAKADSVSEALPDTDSSDQNPPAQAKLQAGAPGQNMDNDFVALDEDDLDDTPAEVNKNTPQVDSAPNPDDSRSEKTDAPEKAAAAAAEKTKAESPPVKSIPKETTKKPAEKSGMSGAANRPSMLSKTIGFALMVLIVAGYIFYNNSTLIGPNKVSEPISGPFPGTVPEAVQPAQPAIVSTVKTPPQPPSRLDKLTALLEEATGLRRQLLEKRQEIEELKQYYREGITELEENIYQAAQKEGIRSFEQALKNKRIELSLRTIQRRRAYILELDKPALWLANGSEDLLYLTRKARLDLDLNDIADGIDMKRHMRHIRAAVNQYRLSAAKLAVDPQDDNLTPLATIWQQASIKESKKGPGEQISLNARDDQIATEICAGNLGHMAELSRISVDTARCLSRMKEPDLFLNAVTRLRPDAAKELFQWQGNWICLNGIRELSPAVAQYLFKWQGNWISLNGLTEFPPELAEYLLKWEGQQLELMGLKYNKTDAAQKTLKYLALWETTGGKLFVSDEIRKELGHIMVSQLR